MEQENTMSKFVRKTLRVVTEPVNPHAPLGPATATRVVPPSPTPASPTAVAAAKEAAVAAKENDVAARAAAREAAAEKYQDKVSEIKRGNESCVISHSERETVQPL